LNEIKICQNAPKIGAGKKLKKQSILEVGCFCFFCQMMV
jgi:hypothetical protein